MQQNVRGLGTSAAEITKALLLHKPDVMCLTETWSQGAEQFPIEWTRMGYNIHICAATNTNGRFRKAGGIEVLSKGPYARINLPTPNDMMAIVLQTGNTRIIGTYIIPAIGKRRYQTCLEYLKKTGRGKCVIIGDMNARTRLWDIETNSAGTTLASWAILNNFTVHAPEQPTYRNTRGKSTVDLTVTRGWITLRPEIIHGPWNAKSDHMLIKSALREFQPRKLNKTDRFPHSLLINGTKQKIAEQFYASALPNAIAELSASHNRITLQKATGRMVATLRRPWEAIMSPKPPRYRVGWTRSLDGNAQQRTKLLRGSNEDRQRGRSLHREIKREMRRNRRRIDAEKTQSLQKQNYRTVNEAMNALKSQPNKQSTVNPDTFTKFLASQQTHDPDIRTGRFNVFKNYYKLPPTGVIRAP